MAKQSGGGGGIGKAALIPLALLSAFLLCQALHVLPTTVKDEITRWVACGLFAFGAIMFAGAGSAIWCGLCAAMAVVLNPVYPLPLGELFHGAKILGGVIAGAAVVRGW